MNRAYTRLEHLPHDVTLATLSNGLTVIVQENRIARVATVRCFVKNTGSAFEGEYLGMGISHLVEHLVSAAPRRIGPKKRLRNWSILSAARPTPTRVPV